MEPKSKHEALGELGRLIAGGQVKIQDLKPETRYELEQWFKQRDTQRMLRTEGGGLQEQPLFPLPLGPALDVAGNVASELRPTRTSPTLPQAGAEIGGATAGAIGGASLGGKVAGPLGAVVGSVGGAAAGTFLGGVVTGRDPVDAAIEALEQGALEGASMGMMRAGSRLLHGKPLEPTSREALQRSGMADILQEGSKQTEYVAGSALKDRLKGNFQEVYGDASKQYQAVRQATQDVGIEVGDVVREAKKMQVALPPLHVEAGHASFDDVQVAVSELKRQARSWASRGENIKAAQAGKLADQLDNGLQKAAKHAGVADQLDAANKFFRTKVADPYYTDVVQDMVRHSGKAVVDEMSGEKVARSLLNASVDDVRTATKALGTENAQELRSAITGHIFTRARDERGVLQPGRLQRLLNNVEPEKLDALLGGAEAKALRDFAEVYAHGLARSGHAISFGASAAMGGMAGGALGAGIALETANEAVMLGRMLTRSKTYTDKLKAAILTGDPKHLQWANGLLRIAPTQIAGQVARQVSPGAPGSGWAGTLGEMMGMQLSPFPGSYQR